ncbi:histidine kinase [Sphingomonas sabuli]|uniref:Histidine kinase n=1 Tax=Sphingomonas sabuli TaxID=2764186 RepID=A0A7G9L4L5_9SPHN|nr:histidine kinase [Sphingomonas sabuli]
MTRFLAGALASFLMLTGAFLLWQGRAQDPQDLPPAPPPQAAVPSMVDQQPLVAPEATPKSREQKRFDRADKDNDGKIVMTELLQPRRKSYAKLDTNGDGRLSFEEWAHTTVDKFRKADGDRNGALTAAEYATTAPKRRTKPKCGC